MVASMELEDTLKFSGNPEVASRNRLLRLLATRDATPTNWGGAMRLCPVPMP
jgi:hypothetical protein